MVELTYPYGLEKLQQLLPNIAEEDRLLYFSLKTRLLENLAKEKRFGSTEIVRAERMVVVTELDSLTWKFFEKSFTDLCIQNNPNPYLTSEHIISDISNRTIPTDIRQISKELNTETINNLCWLNSKVIYFGKLCEWITKIKNLENIKATSNAEETPNVQNIAIRILEICNTVIFSFEEMITALLNEQKVSHKMVSNLKANLALIVSLAEKLPGD